MSNQIKTKYIEDLAITTAKVADQAIETAKIADLSVTFAKLATNSVSSQKIQNGAVDESKLATDSVATVKIQDLAVTDEKIAAGVDAAKIGSGVVSNAEFAFLDGVTAPIQTQLDGKIDESREGQPLGIATLDGGGKVPASQLPASVFEFKGDYDAATNTPALSDGTGDPGDTYVVSVAGTHTFGPGNTLTLEVGDFLFYGSGKYFKTVASNSVQSVNGLTGVVVLTPDIVGAANQNLSNLQATAINQDLNPDSTSLRRIGSFANRFLDSSVDTSNSASFVVRDYTAPISSSQLMRIINTPNLPSGATSSIAIQGLINSLDGSLLRQNLAMFTASNNLGSTMNIRVETGNAQAGDSGNVVIQTGNATGIRGEVQLNARRVVVSSNIVPEADETRSLGQLGEGFLDVYARRIIRQDGFGGKVEFNLLEARVIVQDVVSTDFQARVLYNDSGESVLEWNGRQLRVGSGTSLNWGTRTAFDSSGNTSFNYEERQLFAADNSLSAVWGTRILTDASEVTSIDWGSRRLLDTSSGVVVDFSSTSQVSIQKTVVMNNLRIRDLLDPALAQDAATKAYVDAQVGGAAAIWEKQKFVLTATDIANQYIDLAHLAKPNSINAFVERLAIHEGVNDDYTTSTVLGVTRISFLNEIATGGVSELVAGDEIYVQYQR